MGVLTTFLKLLKPSENDYYNQQTEQAGNWDKVDNYAVLTNTDKNAVWGGDFGGYIQDPIPKELNKRYIDNINRKAFICIKSGDSSVTSNTIEYFMPCNVVDNLEKILNLDKILLFFEGLKPLGKEGYVFEVNKNYKFITIELCWTSGYPDETFPIKVPTTQTFAVLPVYSLGVLKSTGKYESYPDGRAKIIPWTTEAGYYIRRITYSNN